MATSSNLSGNGTSKRRWGIVAVIVIAVVVLSAFLSLRPRRIRVQLTQVERQDITSTISTNGKMEAAQNFEAHAAGPSTVKRLLVHEGDKVHKGQLLLQLDDSDARATAAKALAQLKAAEASLASLNSGGTQEEVLKRRSDLTKAQAEREAAQRNLDALKRLKESGAASQGEVDAAQERLNRANADITLLDAKSTERFSKPDVARAEADVANARAAYDAALHSISEANVTTPLDGTVYFLPFREGSFVAAGDLLVQVADLHNLQVRAFIDEPEIGRLSKGQIVKISWDAIPGRTWQGVVGKVPTTVINRGTRVVGEIICPVENADLKLLPGVNVSVTVVTSSHQNTLTVPREAVHEQDGQHYVYVIDGSHLKKQIVQTGVANLTSIEITQGLKDKQDIALASLSPTPLYDGASIKIAEPSPS
jgi:HlyD family secretion protein